MATVCETYPSAALAAWELGKGKQTWLELPSNFPFLTADEHLLSQFASDDVCDAVVCALVARARDLGLTIGPPDAETRGSPAGGVDPCQLRTERAARRDGYATLTVGGPARCRDSF